MTEPALVGHKFGRGADGAIVLVNQYDVVEGSVGVARQDISPANLPGRN
jgi:hypothetical protein